MQIFWCNAIFSMNYDMSSDGSGGRKCYQTYLVCVEERVETFEIKQNGLQVYISFIVLQEFSSQVGSMTTLSWVYCD